MRKMLAYIKENIIKKLTPENYVNQKSVMVSWLISYLIIFIIPFTGNCVINVYIREMLKTEVTAADRLKLDILKSNVDNFFFESERMSNELFFKSDMAALAEAETITGDMRYKARELGMDMKRDFIAAMQNMKGYIYLTASDYVLSNGMLIDSDSFYKTYYADSGYTYSEWLSSLTDNGQYARSIHSEYDVDGIGLAIENIRPMAMIGSGSENNIVTVTVIDDNSLFENVDLNHESASVLISDKAGNVLVDYGYPYGTELLNELSFEDDEETVRYNGSKLVVSCIDSDWNDMKYAYVISDEVFNEKTFKTFMISILSVIISVICGAVIIYLAIKRNYKPVRGLMDTIQKVDMSTGTIKNEYMMIKGAVERLISRSNLDASALRKNEDILSRVYLLRAVLERRQSREMKKKLADLGIVFEKPCFCVALFKLEALGQFLDEIYEDDMFEDAKNMAKYAVDNIATELLSRHFVSCVCETNKIVIFVINTDGSDAERELIIRDLTEAKEEIESNLDVLLRSSISETGTDFERLNTLYCDALYTLEYSSTAECGVKDCTVQAVGGQDLPEYSRAEWNELCRFIKLGDMGSVEKLLNDIISETFKAPNTPVGIKKGLSYMLISMIMHLAGELGMLTGEIMYRGADYIDEQKQEFDADKLRYGIMELCGVICAQITGRENEGITLSDDIIKFIEENYSDFDLNITMIGRALGLSSSYVSKMFLNQTGTKLLDYINMYRVEKAKELLRNSSELKVERVGELVGFAVNRSFLRTFKKYEGVSPGAYRDRLNN